ncbi:hypothetical protein NUITMVA1_26640 [Aeromonas hydrophila]|nr:hypothetical protein NUITMVA1_26640 [Aeromonas hydrophila]
MFKENRDLAGNRALISTMRDVGYQIGRFKVCSLMKEVGQASQQPGTHRYQVARSERPDISNQLAHEVDVQQANQVWGGDITYVWAAGCWYYLATVLDLHTWRVHQACCFTPTRATNMAAGHFGNNCDAIV